MTSGRRAPRESAARQAISALVIVGAIGVTLLGGLVITLAEEPPAGVAIRPTSTVFRIATLVLSGGDTFPTNLPSLLPATASPVLTGSPTRRPTLPPSTAQPSLTPLPPSPLTQAITAVSSPSGVMPSTCSIPASWVPYTAQPGDTLFQIGLRYGLLVNTLMNANCLASESVEAGQVLFVPPVTPLPAAPDPTSDSAGGLSTPGATATHTGTDGSCTVSDSIITSPAVGAVLRGTAQIRGTASVPDFSYYKLEIRQDGGPQMFVTFFTATTPVVNGLLAEIDTRDFPNDAYWLRVMVVNTFNTYPEPCSILVYFSN